MSGELRSTGVDLRGLLTVLGAHLYSTPIVAVREIVQNAHDSITRRRIEDPSFDPAAARITIECDAPLRTVRVTDTGSGLTDDEVHAFLATIGAGYTRTLRDAADAAADAETEADLIGQFGLGFLSAFVVATDVTVDTCSYRDPTRSWRYHSTDGEQYSLDPGPPGRSVGTVVNLRLKEQYHLIADPTSLRGVLGRYCTLLDVPVWMDGDAEPINAEAPPWRDLDPSEGAADRRRRDLDFANRFEPVFEPLCTMPVAPHPLSVHDPEVSDARGLLWVQDGGTYGSTDNRHMAVFVRGMMLDDDARDLLPYWAGFIGGVIESDRLTPTASREDLQHDAVYAATKEALTEAAISGLATVAHEQPEVWRRVLARHAEVLRGTALCDDRLFDLLADVVPIPTSQGDITMPVLRRASGDQVHVALGAGGGFEEMLFRALQVPVARGERYAVVSFLRRYVAERGGTLIEIGTDAGNEALFRPGTLPVEAELWLAEQLCRPGEALVPSHFAPAELPIVLVPDREVELKARLDADEADKRMASAALALARTYTDGIDGRVRARLYLNLDCSAVQALVRAITTETTVPGEPGGSSEARGAARLLRSVKALLVTGDARHAIDGGGDDRDGNELLDALTEIAATIERMLDDPPDARDEG